VPQNKRLPIGKFQDLRVYLCHWSRSDAFEDCEDIAKKLSTQSTHLYS
jgi:hypothetical protein